MTKNINNKSNSKLKNNSKKNNIKVVDQKKKLNINIFQDFFNKPSETKYHKIKIKISSKNVKNYYPQKNASKDFEKTENNIYKRIDYEKDHDYFSFNKYLKGKKKSE